MTKIKCVKDKQGRIIPIDKIIEIDSKSKTIVTDKSDYSTVYELDDECYNALLNELEIIGCVPKTKEWSEEDNAKKIELKFNIGDWVIVKTETDEHIVEIIDISYFKSGHPMYITSEGSWFGNDTKARLWNMNYAKDGDILCYDDEVFIYKNFDNSIGYYVCWDGKNIHLNSFYLLTLEEMKTVKPATKEQRKELLRHLSNAGYVFDIINKEILPKND